MMSDIWATVDTGETFVGAPDGDVITKTFIADDIITGALATIAIDQGKATKGEGNAPEPETKALPGAPENKQGDGNALMQAMQHLRSENDTYAGIVRTQSELLILFGVPVDLADLISKGEATPEEVDKFKEHMEEKRKLAAEVKSETEPPPDDDGKGGSLFNSDKSKKKK